MKFLSKAIATTLLAASCLFAQQDEATQQAKPAQKRIRRGHPWSLQLQHDVRPGQRLERV